MTGRRHCTSSSLVVLLWMVVLALRAEPVPDVVPSAAIPFSLERVRLLDGPCRDAMLRDQAYLLSLDCDRLLHSFRINVGLPSSATPYGGWEAPSVELRGHFVGHYLSACSLMFASTGDERLKDRVDYLVTELGKCQAASPGSGFNPGYLSAFPESFIDRVIARTSVWAPWYTLHKIMAGLLDANQWCGNSQALQVATNMAAWVQLRLDPLTTDQIQSMLDTEFGGMNEVLANLYAVTGNTNHLRIARLFDHERMFGPLSQHIDNLDGYHANTQIPKAIGAAREYELTGEMPYHEIAGFFWERVALHRSYVIGGHSDGEVFFPITTFPSHLSSVTCETCNTYNMLKLSRHVFGWETNAAAMDFYERGLLNHILASQEPQQGMMTYYVPMKGGEFKSYSTPENSFWCCTGTGIENHAKYGDTIYFHNTNSLYVNLFIASELDWRDKGLVVRQETSFPQTNTVRLTFQCTNALPLMVRIRYPAWAQAGITIAINGVSQTISTGPGSYVPLERVWETGDVVDISLPMTLRKEALPGDTNTLALLYGPVVLAGVLGAESAPVSFVPLFVGDTATLLSNTVPVTGQPLTFRTTGLGRPGDVTLIPFYQTHHERYAVYWKLLSLEAWELFANSNAVAEARSLDEVLIGNAASESAHNLQQNNSASGSFGGRNWRHATSGGWFSYRMSVHPEERMSLGCTYWGSDSGGRVFDILVDGQIVATQTLTNNSPGSFFDVEYAIPGNLTAGKTNVTVRFQAHTGMTAGGVFGLRMLTSIDPGQLLSITLNVTSSPPGGPQVARVYANFQNLTNHPIVNSSWLVLESSNPQVFTVANNGVVQPVGKGTATLTADYFGHLATQLVTVTTRPRSLRHRYRFNAASLTNTTNIADSANPQDPAWHASLRGAAAISNERLILDGSSGTFVELPTGIISNYDAVTIETWASFGTQPTWSYLLSFGDTMAGGAGSYGFSLTPRSSEGRYRLWVTDTAPGYNHEFQINGPGLLDNQGLKHIVVVLDLNYGSVSLYVDGVLIGTRSDIPFGMSAIHNIHSYLGRSLYNNDPYFPGEVHELRIYEGALSATEVSALYALGPATILADVRLNAAWFNGQIEIQWPTQASSFQLESTTGLQPEAAWSAVTNVPIQKERWLKLTLPCEDAARLFRLMK